MKVWTDKSHYDFISSTAFKKKLFLEKIFFLFMRCNTNGYVLFDRKASNILNTVFMEQHHRKQRQELESEMKVELERSKEELNQQLENELQAELEVSQTQQQQLGDSQTPKNSLTVNSVTYS